MFLNVPSGGVEILTSQDVHGACSSARRLRPETNNVGVSAFITINQCGGVTVLSRLVRGRQSLKSCPFAKVNKVSYLQVSDFYRLV